MHHAGRFVRVEQGHSAQKIRARLIMIQQIDDMDWEHKDRQQLKWGTVVTGRRLVTRERLGWYQAKKEFSKVVDTKRDWWTSFGSKTRARIKP